MEFVRDDCDGVMLIKPDVRRDSRGFFLESYAKEKFSRHGITDSFVQDNHSLSAQKGVVRGLHFQIPPFAQSKLVRVTAGAVSDVVVDLRKSSPTFGKWSGFELSADNFCMLYIPAGFAHGFCTLVENTEVQYKVNAPYSAPHDSGIRWNDPDLGIAWPVKDPILSTKDSLLPFFKDVISPF